MGRWGVIAALLVAVGVVVAMQQAPSGQLSSPPQTFLFRYKGKPGEVNRHRAWFILRMAGTFSGPSGTREGRMEYRSEATYLHKIVSVAEDGTLEIETTKESGKAQMGVDERMRDLPDRPYKRIVRMTDRGKVLEERVVEGEEGDEDEVDEDFPLASPRYQPTRWLDKLFETAFHNIAFPEQAIKVGDTWREQVMENLTPNCKVTITIASRFKELVKLDGRLCAVIESTIDAPIDGQDAVGEWTVGVRGRFSATVTLYFDPERGYELQSLDEGRLVLEVTQSGANRPTITLTHRLISRSKTVLLD